jgi:hypothetical protein
MKNETSRRGGRLLSFSSTPVGRALRRAKPKTLWGLFAAGIALGVILRRCQ